MNTSRYGSSWNSPGPCTSDGPRAPATSHPRPSADQSSGWKHSSDSRCSPESTTASRSLPLGEAFRRHALAVLSEWDRFEAERAAGRGGLAGTVHMYCTVTAAQSVVPDLLARARRTHPYIRLALETGYATDAIDRVRSRDIDLSVAALPSRLPAGVISRELTITPIVFVGANTPGPIADALGTRPIDWAALPLVLPARGLVRDHADTWLTRRGITPRIYAEIDGHEAILSLAALGCGVGVVPKLVLHNSALRDRLTIIPTRPALGQLRIGLCARQAALDNPLVAAIWHA